MLNSSKYFRKHAEIRDSFVVKFSSHRLKILVRGGSRGRMQGVRAPPPPPEMTCGFLIQLVFCKKKTMWFIGVEVEQETSAPPPKKNPRSTPVVEFKRAHYPGISEFHLSTETFGLNFSKNNFCVYYFVPQCSFIIVVHRTVEKQQLQRRLCVGEFQLQL